MEDQEKTKGQLIDDLAQLRQRVAELEAVDMERKRAEEIQQRTAQLEALREVGLELTTQLELDALLQSIVSRAIELLGGTAGGLDLYRPDQDVLEWTASIGLDPAPSEIVLRRGEGLSGQVWETGEPLIVDDYHHWEGRAAGFEDYPFTATVGAPVRWGDEFLGVLEVMAEPPRTFSPADAELLSLFATQAAIAIRNARLYERARRRAERLAVVNRIAGAATAVLRLDDLMETVHQEVAAVFQPDAFFIALYDEEANELDFRLRVDEGIREPPARRPLGAGLTAVVVAEKRSLLIRDFEKERNRLPTPGVWGTMKISASWLGVPMLIGPQLIGVISVQAYRPHAYGEEEEQLLSIIADQVAVAIEQARLYEETRRRALEQETVSRIAYALNIPDAREAFPVLVEGLQDLTGCDVVNLVMMDEAGEQFIISVLESPFPIPGGGEVTPLSATAAAEDIEAGRSHLTADLSTETHFPLEQALYQAGLRSQVTLPLLVGGEAFGALNLGGSETGLFREDQLPVLQQIADVVALALENSLLFQAEREQRERAEALEKAAAALTTTLDFDQVLGRILEQVSRVVPNDATNIMLIEGGQARIVRWRGYERFGAEEFVSTVVFRIPEVPNLQQMLDSGKPIVIPDTATYPGWIHVPVQEWLRSYAAVPIVVRGEVIGFLNVDSATPGFFTQDHAEALRAFAGHAAAAIENARLYEAERRRIAELEALRQASLHLTSTLELQPILEAILDHALKLVAADDAYVFLYDGERLAFGAAQWEDGHQQKPYAEPRPQGLTYTVARSGERIVVPDVNCHPLFRDYQWGGAIVGLPLRVGGRVVGVMTVAFERPHAFDESELRVLGLLADQAAIAIENARLYEAVQQELAERKRAEEALRQRELRLSVLNRMGRALAETFDLARIYRIAYEHVAQLVDCPGFGISLYDPTTLTLRAEFMLDDGELVDSALFPPLDMDIEPTQGRVRAIATRQPEIITDYPAAVEKATGAMVRVGVSKDEHVTGAAMYVPMVARDQVIGLLEVQSCRLNAYGLEEAALLGPVANQIGLAIQNAQLYEEVQQRLAERRRAEEELRRSHAQLQRALEGTINVLVSAIEIKDPYTAGHQRRVTQLACAIASEMGLPEERIEGLRMAGLIHDLGKINIPAEILSKPGQLNDLEWGMIEAHPQIAYDIFKTIDFPWPVAQIVFQHHERMDGSGYPQGLSGEEIMSEARILAVADVVEAMSSHRPYRPARGLDKALEEISQNAGVLYDPEVVDACLKLFTEKGFEFE